jgi:radical SAM protein with 4Fe4S-binding SPASM domain
MAGTGTLMQMISNSPTFCPAPWTSLNIDQAGDVYPCFHCVGPETTIGNNKKTPIQEIIHGPTVTAMRESMSRGEWHSICSWCKRSEETTGASGRTTRKVSEDTLASINNDINFFKLEHLVVNWSNLCNLTCVYCNPYTSTAWQSVLKIPINHVKNEHEDLIELVKTQGHNIQGLSLGGGEPLLQKGLDTFLNYLDPDKVRVMVTTNLSMDITKNSIYQLLRHWPDVEWQISFDNANRQKFEYVRDGANWEQFVKNIHQMKQDGQKVNAHPAYSIYCALDLEEYYEFCDRENLGIFWCELNHPDELDIRRHSLQLRQLAIQQIDQIVDRYSGRTDLAIDTLKGYRNTLEDPSYIKDNYIKHRFGVAKHTLIWHDRTEALLKKSVRLADLWPAIATILNENADEN